VFIVDDNAVLSASGGSPLIDIVGAVSVAIQLIEGGAIVGGTTVVSVTGVGATLALSVGERASLGTTSISSVAAAGVSITNAASGAAISETQPGILGAFVFFNNARARFNIGTVKVGAYGAVQNDLVRCDASGGGFTVTLPAALDDTGHYIAVKKVVSTANVVTVAAQVGETIDGVASITLAGLLDAVWLVSDGVSNWSAVVLPQAIGATRTIRRTIVQPADGSDFTVAIAPAMPDDSYVVMAMVVDAVAIVGIRCPDALAGDRTAISFRVITSAAMLAGEVLEFLVVDR